MITAITGASGHVGINLVRALISRGRKVRIITHSSTLGLETLEVEQRNGDVNDQDSLIRAFEGVSIVYHLAAYISLLMSDRITCNAVNIEGTRNVIEACRRNNVNRLVHFSSIHSLCNEPLDVPIDETRPLVESPKSAPYDLSKASGERLIRQAAREGLNVVIISPTAVIGPYDYRPSHFGQALIMMAEGRIPILLEGGFDWVDARDVAEGAIKAEQTAAAGANYLLSGTWLSVKEIAAIVSLITGRRPPALVCPAPVAGVCAPVVTTISRWTGVRPLFTSVSLKALAGNRNISHAKATRELGYEPRPIKQTLSDTINWFLDNGFIKRRGIQ
ncbi:MAG: NAD-dependent epimerase/dehydratase family protein [Dehalococcoidia bacterium]|nr:NAD-dependent epimerase/dehydratase family protein [Dehalococcoidia bacterium]MDD5648260.1 NAD-dependent epimerase/dehydratase family protein [Dehalococcoidia bacterium]